MLNVVWDSFPLPLAQVLRGVCILTGPFIVILCIRLVRYSNIGRHRKFIYAGVAFVTAADVWNRIERWSLAPTPPLFLATVGLLLILVGLWSMRDYSRKDI